MLPKKQFNYEYCEIDETMSLMQPSSQRYFDRTSRVRVSATFGTFLFGGIMRQPLILKSCSSLARKS
jgi:hypothetical protein